MTWHESCDDFDSRIEASSKDASFNDTTFLLTQPDAENPAGDEVSANKAILALISPVFFAQFYGPLSTTDDGPIEIVDGTAQGFKQLINFICNPKSYKLQVKNVAEVFDISYFAHKYQIGSLVSLCRDSLGSKDWRQSSPNDVTGYDVDILKWAVSSEHGLELKETFPAEHALLVHNCWEYITWNFRTIFPNGALKEGQDLPDEDLMVEILRTQSGPLDLELPLEVEFVLSVALDFYCKLMDKGQKVGKKRKRLKTDNENEWNEKLDKIKSVVQLGKVRPKKLAEIYEKFFNKIPDKVIGKITKDISTNWKDKDTFNNCSRHNDDDNLFEIPFSFVGNDNTDDWIHDGTLPSEVQIKFKTNQNAVVHLDLSKLTTCPHTHESDSPCGEIDCCVDDSITFQNEDYKEKVIFKRLNTKYGGEDFYFYVKENKEATLTFKRKCDRESCDLHLVRMDEFRLSKENFEVNILEVNGQPVTSPCYTFIQNLLFTPISRVYFS